MSKLLHLGTKLKYPLTIGRLLKNPGDEIQKQEPIMQFKFTWKQKVGDPFGDEWEEDQTTIADWDSPADGWIKVWKVHEGMVIKKDIPFVEIEESCPHSVQFAGLCGICGKDMTEVSWASASDDTGHAKINMIHDQTSLTVSEDEASKAEEELQRRLLKNRKLSLVVDLDQTIIHACIEPTVGEWQRDPKNPNYEVVKEVQSFQLNDDWPRGMASGCWYYIKTRPGLNEFLNKISEIYELHVYTMGTRAYAMNIAKIVDPEKKLFGDRIISRDENGSITTKSLSRLFPVNTKMVVIIDDRADVWPKNRPNLVKVVPYDFFLGIGDINSSFLPKREEIIRVNSMPEKNESVFEKKKRTEPEETSPITKETSKVETNAYNKALETSEEKTCQKNSKVSALEELLRMGGGDDQARRLQQTAEQEKLLEKQLIERPLLQMQEKLDKRETEEEQTKSEDRQHSQEQAHHRQNLLKDDDVELKYLEKHLIELHKAFYEEYDKAVLRALSGKLNPDLKDTHSSYDVPDLNIVPDIGDVMPRLKAQTFAGCVIVTSGLFPLYTDILKTELIIQTISFGAKIAHKVSKSCTHLVVSASRPWTSKVRQALKYPHIKIVNQDWLLNSISKWEREDEKPYSIHPKEGKNLFDGQFDGNITSTQTSDESDSSINGDETEYPCFTSHIEAVDRENIIPSKSMVSSQINDLGCIDWSEVDEELAEFMGEEDFENESDASDSTELKRRYEDMTSEEDSENESTLSKKQKLANKRRSRLHDVGTSDEGQTTDTCRPTTTRISVCEVEVTDSEEKINNSIFEDQDVGGDSDLEAFLMAEFEKEEAEEIAKAVDNE